MLWQKDSLLNIITFLIGLYLIYTVQYIDGEAVHCTTLSHKICEIVSIYCILYWVHRAKKFSMGHKFGFLTTLHGFEKRV